MAWVEKNADKVLPKSKIDKAFQFGQNQRAGLMNYLKDSHCEISNNIAENSIRPFTVGRCNWLFSGIPKGASASASVFNIIVITGDRKGVSCLVQGLHNYPILGFL